MREFYPQRVTFAASATWPVSTAALPSVNKLEETPTFSERFTCNLEAHWSDRNSASLMDLISTDQPPRQTNRDEAMKLPLF
jgi:hypothetical protein